MKRAGTGGRSKKSGWHKDARMRMGAVPFEAYAPPARPTRWELLLREMGVDEARVLDVLAYPEGDAIAHRLRQWVRQHCRRVFVPEPVLAALGLSEEEVLSPYVDPLAAAEWGRKSAAARTANRELERKRA